MAKDVKIFRSKFLGLRIGITPATSKNGVKKEGEYVQFTKGLYDTDNQKEIKAILAYAAKNPNRIAVMSRNAIDAHKAALKEAKKIVEEKKGEKGFSQAAMQQAEKEIADEENGPQDTPSSDVHEKSKEVVNKATSVSFEDNPMRAALNDLSMEDLLGQAEENKIKLVGEESKNKEALINRLVNELWEDATPDMDDESK